SRFNELSSKANKTMPALEPLHADFESERLALIASIEPTEDTPANQAAPDADAVRPSGDVARQPAHVSSACRPPDRRPTDVDPAAGDPAAGEPLRTIAASGRRP